MTFRPMTRVLATSGLLATLTSCTNGVNAGKEGGVAFIGMAIMLVLSVAILWFILGRE